MTKAANLTAAIATRDRPAALARCLEALLSGDVLPAEIIIIDQSRDETTSSMLAQHQLSDVPVIHIRQQQRGLSLSRNTALARATYSIVAVTDDDCVPDQGWIAAIARAFMAPTAPDAVTGRVLPLGPETPGLYAVSSRTCSVRSEFGAKVVPWSVGTGANFAVKRWWIDRIGKYDTRLGTGSPGGAGEDIDILYRLMRAGARILYEPEAVIFHERQSKARLIASRSSYGRGIGACCGIWLRQRDIYALRIIGHWLLFRAWLMTKALLRRQWMSVYEELLVLQGTVQGLIYGLLVQSDR